jgi:hypothetical protein
MLHNKRVLDSFPAHIKPFLQNKQFSTFDPRNIAQAPMEQVPVDPNVLYNGAVHRPPVKRGVYPRVKKLNT